MLRCPSCSSDYVVKNGLIHTGKQNHRCRACGRQFVENPEHPPISNQKRELIDRLLHERLSMAGICRVVSVSETWLQEYVNDKYAKTPRRADLDESAKKGGRNKTKLILRCDEIWSFVGKRRCKQWIWLAMDACTRRLAAMSIGNRGETGARGLWANLPAAYRERAQVITGFWEPYTIVAPTKRHRRVGKGESGTQRIERFNNTPRQRCSRLVRKTWSFSKKLENPIGAIWNFIHHDNASLPV